MNTRGIDNLVQAALVKFTGVGDYDDPLGDLTHAAVKACFVLVMGTDTAHEVDAIHPEKQQVKMVVFQGLLGLAP